MDKPSNNRILIVGGDSHFSYLMQRYVLRSAYKIITGTLGEDLLALVRFEKPVAIVMEMDLPETIGWHKLRELKADPDVGKIPIIVCSWLDEEKRGLVEGADVYLRMPILYADFKAALAAILVKESYEKNY